MKPIIKERMLYEINLIDFFGVVILHLFAFYYIANYVYNNDLLDKKFKLKLIIPIGFLWCSMPIYMLANHVYVNVSYNLGNYSSVSGEIITIDEKRDEISLNGNSFRLIYSKTSGLCLTKTLNNYEKKQVEIKYLFNRNDACILSIQEKH